KNNTSIFYKSILSNLSNNYYFNTNDLGFQYKTLILKQGRPLFLNFEMGIHYGKYCLNLGTKSNLSDGLRIGNQSITSKTIQCNIGKELFGIKPGISLSKKLNNYFDIFISSSYIFPFLEKDIIL